MLAQLTRNLTATSLASSPRVFERMLGGLGVTNAIWDFRPDPDRFTLREILAHLADMEAVWNQRMRRMLDEANPGLPNVDENQLAIDHDYPHRDPYDSLVRFHAERADTLRILGGLSDAQWQRTGLIMERIPMTLETLAVHIAGHDGYHTGQVADWLDFAADARIS